MGSTRLGLILVVVGVVELVSLSAIGAAVPGSANPARKGMGSGWMSSMHAWMHGNGSGSGVEEGPLRDRPVVRSECVDAARLVIVGEAPGTREVIEGRPFAGKSGDRLDKALVLARLGRSDVFVTNAVLRHPEGNKSPLPDEAICACQVRLLHEVSRLGPERVLALGGTASLALTGKKGPIERLRGVRSGSTPSRAPRVFRYR